MITIPTWYVRKPYIHFDVPLSPEAATDYVGDPTKVASHPFYPLLTYELITPRIKRLPPGSKKPFIKEPKIRSIAYPSHKDGYIFSYYKTLLERPYEDWLKSKGLGESVTAFRSTGENNITLARKAFEFIKENPVCQVVVTDVESFFDNLDHELLRQIWARFLGNPKLPDDHYAVYKAITHYSVVERHKAYNLFRVRLSGRLNRDNSPKRLCTPKQFREKVGARGLIKCGQSVPGKGIPQGTSLSPLLSNMYMADLDLALHNSLGGKYWRYCDDILVVVPGQCRLDIQQELDSQLRALHLTRSKEKTSTFVGRELSSSRQLQYLGFIFNGNHAVIRSSSIHRYRRKLRKSIRIAKNRQERENQGKSKSAPFRKQSLYNMYSNKPVRGKRIKARMKQRKFRGNFTHYMNRAAEFMNSARIVQQRKNLLGKFRSSIRQ